MIIRTMCASQSTSPNFTHVRGTMWQMERYDEAFDIMNVYALDTRLHRYLFATDIRSLPCEQPAYQRHTLQQDFQSIERHDPTVYQMNGTATDISQGGVSPQVCLLSRACSGHPFIANSEHKTSSSQVAPCFQRETCAKSSTTKLSGVIREDNPKG